MTCLELLVYRILCYNTGLEDPSKLGEPEREYIDEILGRIYAIEYSPKGIPAYSRKAYLYHLLCAKASTVGYLYTHRSQLAVV